MRRTVWCVLWALGCGGDSAGEADCRELSRACAPGFACMEESGEWGCAPHADAGSVDGGVGLDSATSDGAAPDVSRPDAADPMEAEVPDSGSDGAADSLRPDAALPDAASPDAAPPPDAMVDPCRDVLCEPGANATARCVAGECVERCEFGWIDADEDPGNGCEQAGVLHRFEGVVVHEPDVGRNWPGPMPPRIGDRFVMEVRWDPATDSEDGRVFRMNTMAGARATAQVAGAEFDSARIDEYFGAVTVSGANLFMECAGPAIVDGEARLGWFLRFNFSGFGWPAGALPVMFPAVDTFANPTITVAQDFPAVSAEVRDIYLPHFERMPCTAPDIPQGECRRRPDCAVPGLQPIGDCVGPAWIACCPTE